MCRIPQGGVLSEGGVRMRCELGFEGPMVSGGNRGLGAGRCAGTEVLAAALFGEPAFEAPRTNGEGGQHLGAWDATRHRRQYPFPQVKRITTHIGKYGTRSGFMPTAVISPSSSLTTSG